MSVFRQAGSFQLGQRKNGKSATKRQNNPENKIGGNNSMNKRQNPVIENNFRYHTPKEGQPEKYTALREKAKELAYMIEEICPNSREKSVAITQLETAVMWANASIARN
jgi:hypothetical protein